MASIVDELAQQALDDSIALDSLLRRVRAVAALLDLDELVGWADKELYGYEAKDDVPPYRMISGEVQGYSPPGRWLPIVWENQEERRKFSTWPNRDSIGEILDRIQRGTTGWTMSLGAVQLISLLGGFRVKELTNIGLHVDRAVFVNVASAVRNRIAEWAVNLKKAGIKGEGLTFSEPEKKKAHDPGVTINIGSIGHLTGNVGEISGHATISSQTAVAPLDLEQVRTMVTQIRGVAGLPENENAAVGRAVSSLEAELQREEPEQSRIREILRSMRSVAEGAAGNVVALGIVQLITKILGS